MPRATFYKQRKNRMICGVVAGLSDKYGWDLTLARVLAALFLYFSGGLGIVLYIILAFCLPYKEELDENGQTKNYYQQGPRKRKDADVIDDDDSMFF